MMQSLSEERRGLNMPAVTKKPAPKAAPKNAPKAAPKKPAK